MQENQNEREKQNKRQSKTEKWKKNNYATTRNWANAPGLHSLHAIPCLLIKIFLIQNEHGIEEDSRYTRKKSKRRYIAL